MNVRCMVAVVAASFAAGSVGCNQEERAGVETAAARTLISDEDENKLGLQFKQELEGKQGVHYLDDSEITTYVQNVAGKVLEPARRDRPGVDWHVQVIDDPKTVNAFATPGGYLYVYTGLLEMADNEAELAAVWGHEAGHVVARHSARQMVDQYGLEAVAGMALGKSSGQLAQLAAGVAEKGAMLANSRADEDEADGYGVRYASAAGYDPHALGTFFEKLRRMEGNTPKLLSYLSDHPSTPDRITHVNQLIAAKGYGGTDLGADRLSPIKKKLAQHVSTGRSTGGAPPGGSPPSGSAPGGSSSGGGAPSGAPPTGAPPN